MLKFASGIGAVLLTAVSMPLMAQMEQPAVPATATPAAVTAAPAAAVAAAPVAVPLPKDSRDRVVMLCTQEAQRRGQALGAADVSMDEVKDTDVKSDGRASMQAKMNLYTKDSKGKLKKQTKKVKCETKNDVVTSFKVS